MEGMMRSVSEKIEVLRIIAHPVRVRILEELASGVKCVSDFGEFLGISQPNISQHLMILRRYKVIDYYTDGRLRCYYLRDPMVPDLLGVLQKQYHGEVPPPACCPVTKKGKHPGARRN